MLKIEYCLILFVVAMCVDAEILNNLSEKIARLKPRRRDKFVALQEPFEEDEDVKTGRELDMMLVTDRLGFVYCNVKTESFMATFAKKYLNLVKGHGATLMELIANKANEAPSQVLISACVDFLRDDVLRDSGVRFAAVDDDARQIEAIERVVAFDYFATPSHKFTVLRCPVVLATGPGASRCPASVYFSAHGRAADEQGGRRHYFVFGDYSATDQSKLSILMRTVAQPHSHAAAANTQPSLAEAITAGYPAHWHQSTSTCPAPPLRLSVKPDRFGDHFRLFGKTAEAAFLSEKFGFFDGTSNWLVVNQFLDSVLRLRRGYEITSYHEWIRSTYGEQSLSDDTGISFSNCQKYVKGAEFLRRYKPIFELDDYDNSAVSINKNIRLQNLEEYIITMTFLQCRVTFTNENPPKKVKVLVTPVNYRSARKCKEHAFYYFTEANENQNETENENEAIDSEDIIFSAVYENSDQDEDEDASRNVRRTQHYDADSDSSDQN